MKPKFKEDCCFICGIKVFRDWDSQSIFCGKLDCTSKFGDEFECPKCGVHWKDFNKGGIGMGRLTVWTYSCPNHPDYNFKRYTFCSEIIKCPHCNDDIIGEIGVEFLKDNGECLRCDKIRGDLMAERRDSCEEGNEENS